MKKIPCHGETCPVCQGRKKVYVNHEDNGVIVQGVFDCDTCDGDGWILVPDYIEVEDE